MAPCNKTNAYSNLVINIQVQASSTAIVNSDLYVHKGDDTASGAVPTVSGGVITVQIPWSSLCPLFGGSVQPNCTATDTAGGNFDFTIGVTANHNYVC